MAVAWLQPRGVLLLLTGTVLLAALVALADRTPWEWGDRLRWFGLLAFYGTWVVVLTLNALALTRRWWQGWPAQAVGGLAWGVAVITALGLLGVARLWLGWPIAWQQVAVTAAVALLLGMFVWLTVAAARQMQAQEEALLQARHEALLARLEPHFLFNALNTIAALLPPTPQAQPAETALEALATLLRSALAAPSHWSLGQEVEGVRAYLAIETLRFGPRLQVRWQLPQDSRWTQARVPRGVLLPLVENAVRYGMAQAGTAQVDIDLEASAETGILLRVRNDATSPEGESLQENSGRRGFGLGQATVRTLVQSAGGSMAVRRDDGGYVVTVQLPREDEDAGVGGRG